MSGYTYLASPYSHEDSSVRLWRYQSACKAAAWLMQQGKIILSPIAHSHPIEVIGIGSQQNGAFWKRQDIPLLRHASELIVLLLPGHKESEGLKWEIEMAESLAIPVTFLNPEGICL